MKQDIMKIFKEISKINDMYIKAGNIMPTCFMLDKGKISTMIGMAYRSSKEKEFVREQIKKYVLKNGVKAYILMQDAIMTMIDKKTGKHETIDVIIRSIFTPKDKYLEILYYKDKKIIKKNVMTTEQIKTFSSEWNVWNDVEIKDFDYKAYQKIKDENPERYKEVE